MRKEQKLFDFACFREAWLNACLHNRWSRQTPPAVYLFENRIEIVSVGGLPDGLTLEEFYEGKSKPVNLELQQIMVQLDYIEQTGHGVPLIVARYGREVFDITENFITVTIPLNRRGKSSAAKKDMRHLDDMDKKIVVLMERNSNIRVNEISEKTGLGTTAITKRIRRLKEMDIVTREGSKRNGHWIVRH